jgi:hypothetical protein
VEEKPEDRDGNYIQSEVLSSEKEKGIARIAQGEEGDDEKKIFELPVPSLPVEFGGRRGGIYCLAGISNGVNIRDPPPEDPETEQGGNKSEKEDDSEILRENRHQKGGDERSCHGTGMIHGSLETEGLAPFFFSAGLREQCISRRRPHPFANAVKETEKEDVIG